MNVGILGYGYYLPELVVTNQEIAHRFNKDGSWIEERTGIQERRRAGKDISTSDLAAKAAFAALNNANLTPADIDLIIVSTTTPDMLLPSTACLVQNAIGAHKAAAFDIAAACSGFIYGLDIAATYLLAGRYNKILLIGADTYSKITNDEDLHTSILFGDGAGAIVLGEVPKEYGILNSTLGADGTGWELLQVPAGGSRLPLTPNLLDAHSNTIMMSGRAVYQFAVKIFEETVRELLDKSSINLDRISLIIPHQANKRILQSVSQRLEIAPEKIYCNIEKYGNMSSASIPVALAEAYENQKIRSGDYLILIGFGAGLTWGATLIRSNL
ncbi:3-oxoacyl-[acyl-carrier-protein] synthase, KASIII [Dehalobacter sp. UNSWDHB]|uniref:Beta-ketoacyl-[acyl-carrier-protein] synthase III n=1 Tax=Desulforamulus putei DSM 12395 TaxID=1121429 RepID=A0A1M5CWG2_9FIRM|nr:MULTISPECIES: beta-ketoacyl-ACP synthase 3 [Eubacteriales]EQB21881.1 3-oxoacyl-[acyl-carrier-protein] synthase, KASIII [Dehalobacter sp. UNSWDHB]SHF59009.1 3-oxoacyl-[acyl-carrier-protein] synthase-3 [Desulforamulus putei DSM 12395]